MSFKLIIRISLYLGLATVVLPVGFACSDGYRAHLQTHHPDSALTFQMMESGTEINNPTNSAVDPNPQSRILNIKPRLITECVVGDLDIVAAGIACNIAKPLILTVKDQVQEKVLFSTMLSSANTINAAVAQLMMDFPAQTQGYTLNVFLCVDSNNNGKCSDELIVDLNAVSAQIIAQGARSVCAQVAAGMLIFHKTQQFSQTGSVNGAGISLGIQSLLQNSQPGFSTQSTTAAFNIDIPLVKSDPTVCAQLGARGNGCFAKGTSIQLTQNIALPVESLKAGMKVLLSDGRLARITRVIAGPEEKAMVAIETESGHKIVVTSEHPLLTQAGLKLASDLALSDQLKIHGKNFSSIKSIRQKQSTEKVYNFEVDGDSANANHLVIAAGLVSGDLFIQNQMSYQKKISDSDGILRVSKTSPGR